MRKMAAREPTSWILLNDLSRSVQVIYRLNQTEIMSLKRNLETTILINGKAPAWIDIGAFDLKADVELTPV